MNTLKKFSKTTVLTAMVAVVMVMLPSNNGCPPLDPPGRTVLLPDPTSCEHFYSCSNGVAILMHCPDGLHFNAELDVCDWPACAKCENGSNNNGNCNKFYYEHLQGRPGSCTLETWVDAEGKIYADKNGAGAGVKLSSKKVGGIQETCPDKGSGCTVYSCQQA